LGFLVEGFLWSGSHCTKWPAGHQPAASRILCRPPSARTVASGPAGAIVIGTPVVTGLLFGKVCTTGLLQGALVSGCQMAISMISTGGAWDNAKRLVAVSTFDKEMDEHYKNAVIGDLIGDPLKDGSPRVGGSSSTSARSQASCSAL
ncbi:unnamed protein product, partial [Prorocentrum cordatum]